jgi:hypothetical protein
MSRTFKIESDAPLKTKKDAESGFAWQRRIWALDGVLKPLLCNNNSLL